MGGGQMLHTCENDSDDRRGSNVYWWSRDGAITSDNVSKHSFVENIMRSKIFLDSLSTPEQW